MMSNAKIIVVIPARYDSTRFPGKVLAKDTGKYLIQHTYEQARKTKLPQMVIIAADDKKIAEAAKSFGAECVMTSRDCASGTDRIAQAVEKLADSVQRTADSKDEKLNPEPYTLNPNDIIVNVQADEPEIDPANIDTLAKLLIDNPDYSMATLVAGFESQDQISDPNIVKVVTSIGNQASSTAAQRAIYFSRSVIPYDREKGGIGNTGNYFRHLGIYAYRKDFLLKITKLPQSPLEKIEKLEQLRVLENGYSILVAKVKHTCDGIDTLEQYAEFVNRYKNSRRE